MLALSVERVRGGWARQAVRGALASTARVDVGESVSMRSSALRALVVTGSQGGSLG